MLIDELREAGLDNIRNATALYELAKIRLRDGKTFEGLEYLDEVRRHCADRIETDRGPWGTLWQETMLAGAPYRFDDYLMYLEINRAPADRFYMPRRKVLLPMVRILQSLEDGDMQEAFLSMPPRVGKTTLMMFYVTWLMGRDPEKANLYVAYSDRITDMFYQGVLSVLTDDVTYTWGEIFPGHDIQSTDAKDKKLNLDRRKSYPTLTCRSLYGTLNGACDCNGVLIADDLLSGIEEALSKDRLATAWGKADNNMLTRAKEGAKILWVGTRWSIWDPIGIRLDMLRNEQKFADRKWKDVNIPALDEADESNFDYQYGVGFSTMYYQQRRASFERNNDIASWAAQYMGQPIERDGALFEPGGMQYYNGVLPDEEPLAVYSCVDVAFGGGDYLSMPVVYEYENGDRYVADWVFDAGDKRVTEPKVLKMISDHGIRSMEFEANNGGEGYKTDIDDALREAGIQCRIMSRPAPTQKRKAERIFEAAPEIRDMIFLEDGKRNKDYSLAMQNLFSFTMFGKNKHDDAPDSLAMLVRYHGRTPLASTRIFKRPF